MVIKNNIVGTAREYKVIASLLKRRANNIFTNIDNTLAMNERDNKTKAVAMSLFFRIFLNSPLPSTKFMLYNIVV